MNTGKMGGNCSPGAERQDEDLTWHWHSEENEELRESLMEPIMLAAVRTCLKVGPWTDGNQYYWATRFDEQIVKSVKKYKPRLRQLGWKRRNAREAILSPIWCNEIGWPFMNRAVARQGKRWPGRKVWPAFRFPAHQKPLSGRQS